MPSIKRTLVLFVGLFFSLFLFPPNASSYFTENFADNPLNPLIWNSFDNSGSIIVDNNKLSLLRSINPSTSFPYLSTVDNIFPTTSPFTLKIKYRYLSAGNFGDGITISSGAVPANGVNPDSDLANYMIFMIYQDASNGLSFGKFLCDVDGNDCSVRTFLRPFTNTPDLNEHEVRVDYTDEGQYFIYLDGSTNPEFISGRNQVRPQKIWLGNSLVTNSQDLWSSFEIDYIKIEPFGIATKLPIIIIPGFGGSWDLGAIMSGTPGTNWQVPEQVTVYDKIMENLVAKGYTEGTDLFLFPFDWRKPLDRLADDLNAFILSKNLTGKIDLVGHSMGGLVARSYGQKYGLDKVNKIVTAGSPHLGLTDAYGLWEGTVFWGDAWWEKALLSLATELNHKPGERKVDTLRRIAPAIKDLLPTSNYVYLNGLLKPWQSMKQVNNYLGNLNTNSSQVNTVLIPLWSGGELTRNTINTVKRSFADTVVGLWEDGKPKETNPFNLLAGDGTVTSDSAKGPFAGLAIEGSGNHNSMLATEQNIKAVFDALGIDSSGVTGSSINDPSSVFLASLRSPGRLEVCNMVLNKCDENLGLYFSDYKLFMLPGYNGEKLRVRVYEAGLGSYKLHLGDVDESDSWTELSGSLRRRDQIDTYEIIEGSTYPKNKEHCKKEHWRWFSYTKFKNQDSCFKFVEDHDRRGWTWGWHH